MNKFALLIDVFDKNVRIDSFIYCLDSIHPITFPDKEPYQGLKLYISGSLENGFEFSPDGYELWIRFSKNHPGKWMPYLINKQYTFILKIIEEPLCDIAKKETNQDVYDSVDKFNHIRKFKKEI